MSTEELMSMRGTLSPTERPAFKAEMQKRMQSMSPQQRQQLMQGRGMGKGKSGMQNRPSFETFDLNKDGKVTEKEFYDAQAAHMGQKAKEGKMMKNAGNAPTFDSIDKNHDKIMTPDEFSAFQAERMKRKMKGM